jgi:hypothetical protein
LIFISLDYLKNEQSSGNPVFKMKIIENEQRVNRVIEPAARHVNEAIKTGGSGRVAISITVALNLGCTQSVKKCSQCLLLA